MKHDYQNVTRGAVIEATGKTRVTMYLDDDVIEFFRERATKNGRGYQTEINSELRKAVDGVRTDMVEAVVVKGGARSPDSIFVIDLSQELRGLREDISGFRMALGQISSDQVTHHQAYIGQKSGTIGREAGTGEVRVRLQKKGSGGSKRSSRLRAE